MTSLDQTVIDNSSAEPSSAGRDGLDAEATTAANLLAGLATRLRTAYERGADIAVLAAASHQSASEVRRLLERAGVDLPADDEEDGDRSAALRQAARATHDPQQLRRIRRPTPSRRLSRLHPHLAPSPLTAAAPPAPTGPGGSVRRPEPTSGQRTVEAVQPQTPMGILIGASPTYSEPPAQPEDRHPRRVPARVVRVGRGTSLVVLPSWRAAIAVSVATDVLLRETGLSRDALAGAHLTVLMNPSALHDRELGLCDWRPETFGKRGRRGDG